MAGGALNMEFILSQSLNAGKSVEPLAARVVPLHANAGALHDHHIGATERAHSAGALRGSLEAAQLKSLQYGRTVGLFNDGAGAPLRLVYVRPMTHL